MAAVRAAEKNKSGKPLLVWLGWLEHQPVNQKVAGLVSSKGVYRRQLIDVPLPLSLSLLSPLLKSVSMLSSED